MVRRDSDKYRDLTDKLDEAEVPDVTHGVYLDALLKEDLLWGQAGDAVGVNEEVLNTRRPLVEAVGHDAPISKKGYIELVRSPTGHVQKAQLKSYATTRQLSEKEGLIEELEVKVCHLANNSVPVVDLKKQLTAWDARIALLEEAPANLNTFLV